MGPPSPCANSKQRGWNLEWMYERMSGREGERASEENNGDADEPRMRWVRSLSLPSTSQVKDPSVRPSVVPLSAAAPIAVDSHAFYGLGRRIAVCRIFPDSPPPH